MESNLLDWKEEDWRRRRRRRLRRGNENKEKKNEIKVIFHSPQNRERERIPRNVKQRLDKRGRQRERNYSRVCLLALQTASTAMMISSCHIIGEFTRTSYPRLHGPYEWMPHVRLFYYKREAWKSGLVYTPIFEFEADETPTQVHTVCLCWLVRFGIDSSLQLLWLTTCNIENSL